MEEFAGKALKGRRVTFIPAAATPALKLEDRERIDALTAKLDGVDRTFDIPLKHYHIIDPVGNIGLIAWFGAVAMLVATLFVIHAQGDTIVRNRDNDLKYRYIQMQREAESTARSNTAADEAERLKNAAESVKGAR